MPMAWQVRQREQEEFVRKLGGEVRDLAEKKHYEIFLIEFGSEVLKRLKEYEARKHPREKRMHEEALRIVRKPILELDFYPRIHAFARVESEAMYLWYLLFKELEKSIGSIATRDYLGDQVLNPVAVYGVKATEEVDAGEVDLESVY